MFLFFTGILGILSLANVLEKFTIETIHSITFKAFNPFSAVIGAEVSVDEAFCSKCEHFLK